MYGESRMKNVVYNVKSEYKEREEKRKRESREIYTRNLAEEKIARVFSFIYFEVPFAAQE